jgi:hypothetical protein
MRTSSITPVKRFEIVARLMAPIVMVLRAFVPVKSGRTYVNALSRTPSM